MLQNTSKFVKRVDFMLSVLTTIKERRKERKEGKTTEDQGLTNYGLRVKSSTLLASGKQAS